MLLLRTGINEEVVVTLTENVTLTTPDIIFVFVNTSTLKKVACLAGEDISVHPSRSNKYTLTVTPTPDHLEAEVALQPGFHNYFVYEIADHNDFDFAGIDTTDLSTLSGLLEQGIMKYVVDSTDLPVFKENPPSVKVYGS
jgi:hypothetical protein